MRPPTLHSDTTSFSTSTPNPPSSTTIKSTVPNADVDADVTSKQQRTTRINNRSNKGLATTVTTMKKNLHHHHHQRDIEGSKNGLNTCKDALKVGLGILKKVGGGGGGGKEGVNDKYQRKGDVDKTTTTIDGVLRPFTPIISQRDSGSFVKSKLVNQGSNSSIDIDIAITNTNTTIETNINNDDSIQTSIDDTPIRSISTPPVQKRPVSQDEKDDIVVVIIETPIGESYYPPPPVPTRPNGWEILKSTSGDDSVTSKQGDIDRKTNPVSQSGSSPVQGHQSSQYSFDSQSQRSLTLSSHLDAYPNASDVEDPTFGRQPSTTTTTTTSYDDQQGIDNQSRSNGYYEYHISPPQDSYSEQYYHHSNDSRSYFIDQSNISSGASTYPSTPITAFGCYDGTYTHEPFNIVNSSSSGFTSTASSMGRSSGDFYNRGYADDSNVWSTRAYDESMSRANEMMSYPYNSSTHDVTSYYDSSNYPYTSHPYQYQHPWGYYYYYPYTAHDGQQVHYPMYYDPVMATTQATGHPPFEASDQTRYYTAPAPRYEQIPQAISNQHVLPPPPTTPSLHRASSSINSHTPPHRPSPRVTSMNNVRTNYSNSRSTSQHKKDGKVHWNDAGSQMYLQQPGMKQPSLHAVQPIVTQAPLPWPKNLLLRQLHVDKRKEWPLTVSGLCDGPAAFGPWQPNHLNPRLFATIQELYGHILDFALDPLGCYALVRSFEIATHNEQRQALAEILPSTMEVCMDQIGHRFLQRLINALSDGCRGQLIDRMLGKCVNLAMDVNGYRVLIAALIKCSSSQAHAIFDELCVKLHVCLNDSWAHIVLIKAFESLPSKKNNIIALILPDFLQIATNAHGTHLLQRCFASLEYEKTKPLYSLIIENAHFLAWNGHGNFVVQYVFDHAPMAEKVALYLALKGQFFDLSQQKFASHVVERALERCDYYTKCLIVDELSGGEDMMRGYGTLRTLMVDDYANYIVQSMLKNMNGPKLGILIAKLQWVLNSFMVGERFVTGPKYNGRGVFPDLHQSIAY